MKKKELAATVEAYRVGMRTTFEDVTAYFRSEIQRLDNAVIERSDDVAEKFKDLAENWADVFNSLKEIVDKNYEDELAFNSELQDKVDRLKAVIGMVSDKQGPDQAEFNRYKTAVAKMFERKAAELDEMFGQPLKDFDLRLNGLQCQQDGFEKFVSGKSDDVTEKFKDLAGSLRRLVNDHNQFEKLMTTQLEAALKNNTQASKNMKDLHQTQVDIKDEVEAIKLTLFNHNRKLEILEKEFDLARVANKLESLGYLAESGGKDGQSLLEKLAAQLAKNTESVLSLQEEFTDFVSGEELQEQIDHLKVELHSARELWHHRTSVEILQQENTELKMQLANLSENFDCLNNTVNEIMKREAIRDRGIAIPCPSTDEYDELMEKEIPKIYPIVPENKLITVLTSEPKRPSIEIVVATDCNGVIGVDGKIPWDCPEDRKFFKELTEGHVVVMGRKTYESLPEEFQENGLPHRTNVIMSRDEDYIESMNYETGFDNGSICFTSRKPEAIARLWKDEANGKIFIIGGEEIYKLWMPYVDVIHLSEVYADLEPKSSEPVAKFEYVDNDWRCVERMFSEGFEYSKLVRVV